MANRDGYLCPIYISIENFEGLMSYQLKKCPDILAY